MARAPTQSFESRGFTLLEVIIAFIIMALIIGATFDTFSTGFRQAAITDQYAGAVIRAESRLALIGQTEPLAVGVTTGQIDQHYSWRTEITPVVQGNGEDQEPTPEENSPFRLYAVVVSVFWQEAGDTRDVTLRSLRLVLEERP
jgi:general secretion pathway protein I